MKYMGSKNRIAKDMLPIILKDRKDGQYFVDLFCGGCNLIDKVENPRIANDINEYVIEMFKSMIYDGYIPTRINKEYYDLVKNNYNIATKKEVGYIGINCSYSGKWFGGFADIVNTKCGVRDYQQEAFNNVMSQIKNMNGIKFFSKSYDKIDIPLNSIIYCDIPYKNTTKYKNDCNFDYDKFYDWCIEKYKEGHKVFISEYNMPEDKFECVWSKEVKSSLSANGKSGGNKNSTEKLFIVRGE